MGLFFKQRDKNFCIISPRVNQSQSRKVRDASEWKLNPSIFQKICKYKETPDMDSFREKLPAEKLSEESAILAANARRPGTLSHYESALRKWDS